MYPLRVGVTMSVHKLTAGSGYDYLTRQVAALDATEKGHTGLASYYAERGESPGVWIGSGLDGIDGLAADDPVTAEQMRALFGCGLHPLAELRQQQLEGPDLTLRDFQSVSRLGAPFKIVDNDLRPFRLEVAKRIAALNTAIGWPAGASMRRLTGPGCGLRWPDGGDEELDVLHDRPRCSEGWLSAQPAAATIAELQTQLNRPMPPPSKLPQLLSTAIRTTGSAPTTSTATARSAFAVPAACTISASAPPTQVQQ
jgi:hypothetical protein